MKLFSLLFLLLFQSQRSMAQLANSSYTNSSGEKILRFELILPVTKHEAWQFFTNDSLLRRWIAPLVHILPKTGGYIITNYDKNKTLSDSSSITCGINAFLENELIVLKVKLNENFSKEITAQDEHLQEVIQFVDLGNGSAKIISSMIGWGTGLEWEKTFNFFAKGNEWTYRELLKLFIAPR